jgi:protein SDA1
MAGRDAAALLRHVHIVLQPLLHCCPAGRHKKRKNKEERLASVMAGREGREAFGSRSGIKKKKQGGLSEREKQRSKSMPIAARIQQLRNRSVKARNKSNPRHFKGHVRK